VLALTGVLLPAADRGGARLAHRALVDVLLPALACHAALAVARRLRGRARRVTDVLKHLAEGETTGQIADALGISEATVRAHVEHMRLRLGVGTRAALVSRGFRLGYLS
jgi:DNA-binding CsgD family transcriptional regulator